MLAATPRHCAPQLPSFAAVSAAGGWHPPAFPLITAPARGVGRFPRQLPARVLGELMLGRLAGPPAPPAATTQHAPPLAAPLGGDLSPRRPSRDSESKFCKHPGAHPTPHRRNSLPSISLPPRRVSALPWRRTPSTPASAVAAAQFSKFLHGLQIGGTLIAPPFCPLQFRDRSEDSRPWRLQARA